MTKPDWFILLEQWRPKKMGVHGVTLPFIVGALAYKSGEKNLSARHVRNVLDDIINHPVEDYVTEVSWCPDLSAPVLNTVRIDDMRMKTTVAFARPSEEGESLVFGPNLCGELHWNSKDPETLLERLVDDATEPVAIGQYSRKRILKERHLEFEYGDFEPKELDYIQSTIMTS
jgi:hypothetical protein